jgi:hypothetical protein
MSRTVLEGLTYSAILMLGYVVLRAVLHSLRARDTTS